MTASRAGVLLGLRKEDGDWREETEGSPTGEGVVEEGTTEEEGGSDRPPLSLLLPLILLDVLDESKPSLVLPPLKTFSPGPKAFKWAKTAVAALSPLSNAPFNVAVFR